MVRFASIYIRKLRDFINHPCPLLEKEGIALTSSWPQFLTARGLANRITALFFKKIPRLRPKQSVFLESQKRRLKS